jgi:hypothetical protein
MLHINSVFFPTIFYILQIPYSAVSMNTSSPLSTVIIPCGHGVKLRSLLSKPSPPRHL